MTVTVTDAKTATDPKPDPSDKSGSGTGGAKPSAPGTSAPDADSSSTAAAALAGDSTPKTSAGFLAHTGADATPWIAAGAGLLVSGGVVTLVVARPRTADGSEPEDSGTAS
ncbi:hypothetical protein ACWGH3_32990 [Streptomyces sp. NPDC054884]